MHLLDVPRCAIQTFGQVFSGIENPTRDNIGPELLI